MAFLSSLDERARPKGSRDPLGFELVWTHFGRKVVGNLTTITSSWRIFSVALLGFHWCNQLCRDAHPQEKLGLLQQYFIRFEQLAAYLRSSSSDHELLGINRVRKRLSGQPRSIPISVDPSAQILSNQLSYGMWGLYSTALRESGLVKGEFRELTEDGLAIASAIEADLDKAWHWDFMRGNKKSVTPEELARCSKKFTRAIAGDKIKDAVIKHLLRGPVGHRCQHDLYEAAKQVAKPVLQQDGWSTARFIDELCAQTHSSELRQAFDEILRVERLLVTANVLFDYCRRKDGESLEAVSADVANACDFSHLAEDPLPHKCPSREDLNVLSAQLRAREVLPALRSLLALNKKVMEGRGGAAWVEEKAAGELRVRMKAEVAHLPAQKAMQSDWHYDYFLRSFARIAGQERT